MSTSVYVSPFRSMWYASWLYPIKGLFYFIGRPYLWPLLKGRLLPCFLLSAFVLANLFIWTWLPQVAFLAIWHGPAAWLNATVLVLGEGAAIVAILFEGFFVDETQVDIFDSILVHKGLEDLVETSRPVAQPDGVLTPLQRLGKPTKSAIYGPFSFRQIFEFIVFLPINLVPIVGVPVFLLLTGYRAGPLQHWRYFALLGLTKSQRKVAMKRRWWQYMWFGTVALMLQLVPVLSMLFLLTTSAGSALWVVDIENARRVVVVAQPQGGEEYSDNPV